MTPVQVRMARAALSWTHQDLASAAAVAARTVFHLEAGRKLRPWTLERIAAAFAQAGIIFIDDAKSVGIALERERA